MKKLLLSICLIITINSFAQSIDTAKANLTLRYKEWKWLAGKFGFGEDSVSAARIRALKNAIIAANPATETSNVTINNVPGEIIVRLYAIFLMSSGGDILNLGTTSAERFNIYTNIKAITNNAIVPRLLSIDAEWVVQNQLNINKGKIIIVDNN